MFLVFVFSRARAAFKFNFCLFIICFIIIKNATFVQHFYYKTAVDRNRFVSDGFGDFYGYSFKLLRNTVAHFVSQLITLLGITIMLKWGGRVRPQFELGRELQGKRAEVSPS